jgi:hypothetical protein
VALVGFYELLMMINRGTQETTGNASPETVQAAARMPACTNRLRPPRSSPTTDTAGRRSSTRVARANSTWDSRASSWVRADLATLAAG